MIISFRTMYETATKWYQFNATQLLSLPWGTYLRIRVCKLSVMGHSSSIFICGVILSLLPRLHSSVVHYDSHRQQETEWHGCFLVKLDWERKLLLDLARGSYLADMRFEQLVESLFIGVRRIVSFLFATNWYVLMPSYSWYKLSKCGICCLWLTLVLT